jgi:VanZ family protein
MIAPPIRKTDASLVEVNLIITVNTFIKELKEIYQKYQQERQQQTSQERIDHLTHLTTSLSLSQHNVSLHSITHSLTHI